MGLDSTLSATAGISCRWVMWVDKCSRRISGKEAKPDEMPSFGAGEFLKAGACSRGQAGKWSSLRSQQNWIVEGGTGPMEGRGLGWLHLGSGIKVQPREN